MINKEALAVLDIAVVFPGDYDKIMQADWYLTVKNGVIRHGLFLIDSTVADCLETDPVDAGVDLDEVELIRVDNCLKRYNAIDGFYSA